MFNNARNMKMKTGIHRWALLAMAVLAMAIAGPGLAQQVAGVLGSPSATASISGKQLPAPDPKFAGVIQDDALQSKPWWAPRIVPPKGAPNVLLIITDDAGFGVPSTFGGVIPTPAMDRIANEGLRYNRMFSTALCSPTRAALITGRNHHSAGFGVISEQSTGYPGYNSIIGKDKATIGRILLDNGYATSWFGKNHNTPAFAASQVGPFDQWPSGMGFEYFYGFVGGDANQWQPNLFRNTTQIYPFEGKPGWNLVTGMADDAIEYMTRVHQIQPDKPIFIKYAPGATHAPHHPTQGMGGQDQRDASVRRRLREAARAHLREPEAARRDPPGHQARALAVEVLKPWDQLSADEKKLFIRQVEVFAAYAAYSDHEIGRVIQTFQDLGQARQHADHLHQRRQRHQRRGRAAGHAERGRVLQRREPDARGRADEVVRRLGHRADLQPHVGRLVVGLRHAVRLVQAERLASSAASTRTWSSRGRRASRTRAACASSSCTSSTSCRPSSRRPASRRRRWWTASSRRRSRAPASPTPSTDQCQGAVAAQDAVLRDDGPVGAVPRRLAAQHQGQPRAVGGLRRGQPRPAEQPGVPALQPEQGLQPDRGHRRAEPAEGQGDAPAQFLAEAKKYQVFPLDASVAAASSRRARTSPPGARSSSTRDRWSACRRAIRRSC
jgi:hypothetical protein